MKKIDIVFTDLCKKFGSLQLYEGLCGEIAAGTCVAVLGRNGAGKSTFLKILAGMLAPTAGKIEYIAGECSLTRDEFRQNTGFLTPEVQFYENLTAKENLAFFTNISGKPCAAEVLEQRLSETALFAFQDERVKNFSTGMRQRLKLALLLAVDRPVWFLDEPSSNLDAEGCKLIGDAITNARTAKKTILLATNDLAEVEYADYVIRIA